MPFDIPGAAASTFGEVADFDKPSRNWRFAGFGQDEDQMVPLHMAMVAATVANGGKMMKPYIVDATLIKPAAYSTDTKPSVWKTPISPQTPATLNELMVGVVQDGTAKCCLQLDNGIQAAAKTGTAQLNAAGQPQRSHAWIIAFAPAEDPQYAIAVISRGPTPKSALAPAASSPDPIAKTVLDYALAHPLVQG